MVSTTIPVQEYFRRGDVWLGFGVRNSLPHTLTMMKVGIDCFENIYIASSA